jgi:alkylhydroperoxidase family enzyme
MQPRIENPAMAVPGAMAAFQRLAAAARHAGVPESTGLLVALRASQINGCSVAWTCTRAAGHRRVGQPIHRPG